MGAKDQRTLTPARHKAIVSAVRAGAFRYQAAAAAGIARSTLIKWEREGKDDIEAGNYASKQAKLVLDLERAEQEQVEELCGYITLAAKNKQWQAAAWMLERRHKYVRPAPVVLSLASESTSSDGKGVSELVARLSLGVNSEDDSE